jgi:hypothetical protein
MGQLNMHVTPEFDLALSELMRRRQLATKSEAIRVAVQEAVARLRGERRRVDYREWVGAGLAVPPNANPRFRSDDDLWQ